MELSYDKIIEYLCNNTKNKSYSFCNKKNIMTTIDSFPETFSEYLINTNKVKFYKYGITIYNNNQENISFWSSLYTLIDKNYITSDNTEEMEYIEKKKKEIIDKIKKISFEFKFKFSKQILLDRIDSLMVDDGILLQVLTQIFEINFIIFDFKDIDIKTVYSGKELDPWRPTILFAKYEQFWEPIFSDKKLYSINDIFIKKIITSDKFKLYNNIFDKKLKIITSIKELNIYNNLETDNIDVNDLDDNNIKVITNIVNNTSDNISEVDTVDMFINPSDQIKKLNLNKSKLNKMKKDEIFKIIEDLKIPINKSITKVVMIESILNYSNNYNNL